MKKLHLTIPALILISVLVLFACSDGGDRWAEQHGYGPVTEPLEPGDPDEVLALEGKQVFDTYCESCHGLNVSISGPALGRVAGRRTPEFVINYTLNPRENRQNHPEGQKLAGQYPGIMAETGITLDQARAVLEYLRYYSEHREEPEE